ncbi:uncharacterized protein [Nicotiana sylvestris]|uniref:uncharacterized protein n=1 Tax=Nicotiana sylvestris TaxID=4096 RepID=UPI00388C7EB1
MAGENEVPVTDKTTLDSTSSLYMHPSKSAGSMLVPELEDKYDPINSAKLYQLQKEINDLSQGNLDITGYYTKMKKLWVELNTLNIHAKCACKCTCGARENMHKVEHDRRESILMINPLPTIAQAFSILIQEEKQREVKPSNNFSMDSTALNASGSGNRNFRTNYSQQGNNNTNSGYKGNQLNNRPWPFCEYCKRPGHPNDKCYKLQGFPQNSKFNKGRRIAGNVFGSSSEGAAMKDDGNGSQDQEQSRHMHSLTKEQYGQLLSILESFQGEEDKSTSNTINGGAVNVLQVKVTLIDDVVLSPRFSLKKVFFVPSFKFNLISVHYLTVQLDCIIVFAKYVCILLQGLLLKRPLEIGKAKTDLYLYCSSNCNTGSTSSNSSSTSIPCFTSNKDKVHSVVNTYSSFSSSQLANTNKLVSTILVAPAMVTPSHSSNRSSSLPYSHYSVNSSSNKSDSYYPLHHSRPNVHLNCCTKRNQVTPISEVLVVYAFLPLSKHTKKPRSNPHIFVGYPFGTKGYKSPLGSQTSGTFPVADSPREVSPTSPHNPTVMIQDPGTSVLNQSRPSRTLKIPIYLKG